MQVRQAVVLLLLLNIKWCFWSAGESGNPRALLFVRRPRVSPACAVSQEQQLSFIYKGFPSLPGGKWWYVGVSTVCELLLKFGD